MQVFGLKSTFLESRKITIQKRELIIEEVHILVTTSTIIPDPSQSHGDVRHSGSKSRADPDHRKSFHDRMLP